MDSSDSEEVLNYSYSSEDLEEWEKKSLFGKQRTSAAASSSGDVIIFQGMKGKESPPEAECSSSSKKRRKLGLEEITEDLITEVKEARKLVEDDINCWKNKSYEEKKTDRWPQNKQANKTLSFKVSNLYFSLMTYLDDHYEEKHGIPLEPHTREEIENEIKNWEDLAVSYKAQLEEYKKHINTVVMINISVCLRNLKKIRGVRGKIEALVDNTFKRDCIMEQLSLPDDDLFGNMYGKQDIPTEQQGTEKSGEELIKEITELLDDLYWTDIANYLKGLSCSSEIVASELKCILEKKSVKFVAQQHQ